MKTALLVLLGLIIFLSLRNFRFQKEMKHLYRQLTLLEKGSHIELTAQSGTVNIRKVYHKLNQIFAIHQKQGEAYQKSQKILKQTISDIAHDIRTPLTGAMGYLQMLEEGKDETKRGRYLEVIKKRLEELKNMLEELFLYTKLTSPEFTLECSSTPVFPALCEALAGFYYTFAERGIEPEISFEEEGIEVSANQDALQRVFRNLIQNALIHGTGNIRITQKGSSIFFYNAAAGKEDIDTSQLFERFYKEEKSRNKGSSGLGLAIVKELMERMGGSVSVRQKRTGD